MTSANWIYLILLIPLVGGYIHWRRNDEFVLWEWAASFAAAVLILVATFGVANHMVSGDKEVYSGVATEAVHTPWWHATWTELETYTTTDSKGNVSTHQRLVTKTRTYPPEWWAETTIGRINISEGRFNKMAGEFGKTRKRGHRPDMDRGDPYDYYVSIDSGYPPRYPVHKMFSWSNPLKGTDSIRLGAPVPEEEALKLGLYEYPESRDPFVSQRVINAPISTHKWDQMCAILGPTKKVNLTIINFDKKSMKTAVKQRDYWRNGRKNDLVLCYGEGWAYVFGWSESNLVKKELEGLLLENKINDDLIPKIASVVQRDFKPYNWEQHKDTPRPISGWVVFLAFLLMGGSQVGLYMFFSRNDHSKKRGAYSKLLRTPFRR